MEKNPSYIQCPLKKIKIGALDYEIMYMDSVDVSLSSSVGVCDYNSLVIKVFKTENRFRLAETFLHELLHSVENVMVVEKNADIDVNSSEAYTKRMTAGLGMVIRDNPLIFVWLLYLFTGLKIFDVKKYKNLIKK